MSLKTRLVKIVRQLVPASGVRLAEEVYRRCRAVVVAGAYGFPARNLKVIAVTGTNGKTTTVNFVNEILKASGQTTAMFSTAVIEVAGDRRPNELNATVATVAEMQAFFKEAQSAAVDHVVMEFPSHALQQHKLAGVPVEVAVMTNLTQDHLDYHKTMANYAAAKAKLFQKRPRYIVLNRDDAWYDYYAKFPAAVAHATYGVSQQSDVQITDMKETAEAAHANLRLYGKPTALTSHLPGTFNLYNLAAAATVAQLLSVDVAAITAGAAQLKGIPGRFERVPNNRGVEIVVDYAHTPDGLEKLLLATREITKDKVVLVFGSCGDRDKSKRPIMGDIAARLADALFVTDEENYTEPAAPIRQQIIDGIKKSQGKADWQEIADRREAIQAALDMVKKGDTILITGLGHEVYRIIDGKRVPWNDTEVVEELLRLR